MDSDEPSKRILTEEGREGALKTDQFVLATGADTEQLAIALRNVGARARHSVSQGYLTPPSTSFVKAQSTGTIFRSMNDTLRQAHLDLPTTDAQHFDSPKKRSRPVEGDEPGGEQGSQFSNQSSYLQTMAATRPTKPLKLSKSTFVRAPSLPTGSSGVNHHISESKGVIEEEDWSLNMETEEQQFEAMEL